MIQHGLLSLGFLLALGGCSDLLVDDGHDAGDAAVTDATTDVAADPDRAPAAAIAACEASVDAVRAACVTEDPTHNRLCLYDALRPLCTSGRTSFVKAVFDCLRTDACQSPSDPSDATECVRALLASQASSADRALGATLCDCDSVSREPNCDTDLPAFTLASTMLLRERDVSSLRSCTTTMGCGGLNNCLAATPLATANACP